MKKPLDALELGVATRRHWLRAQSRWLFTLTLLFCGSPIDPSGLRAQDVNSDRYFGIHAIDEETGRGIPLVEFETVHHLLFVTDSNGWSALDDPGLMQQKVFFHVRSHGYECARDRFGYAGVVLTPQRGKRTEVRLRRINVAQRLYRITGEGIYRDSVLLGEKCPIAKPWGAGKVLGQDSVQTAIYQDQIYWFWGDTNRMRYPLGHFRTAGAVSQLPGHGGLDPARGVDLQYFVGADGFSRPMARLGVAKGLIWIDAVCMLPDKSGVERLVCHYSHMKSLGESYGHGVAVYNTATNRFDKLADLDESRRWAFPGGAHPIHHRDKQTDYLYLGQVFPTVRMPATLAAFGDTKSAEAWTCLRPGSTIRNPVFVRSADGKLQYAWRKDTPPVDIAHQWQWIRSGKIQRAEAHYVPLDCDTNKPVRLHRGSVAWNPYRKKWIMIAGQQGGTSQLGEIWYAESARLTGPWKHARKIVTHDKYSFYNPVHHSFLDQQGGRIIYFEGTYTTTFSGNTTPTPRYDYNQIMYQLDLDDPRLKALASKE